ncbi:MAG: YceI family protein [Devosia sp.]|uniref:YceI family protein n=1 Tax=Devosia sp. TaxID=1871048 RepID=UPI00262D675B|nr:YceI family protein [Devosia sp.]MDB5526995.1 YceI family protein [Devosia sp.]
MWPPPRKTARLEHRSAPLIEPTASTQLMELSVTTRFLAAGAMTALLALSALAPQAMAQEIATKDPNAVRAGDYKVEPYHTQIGFSISHLGFTDLSGFFSGVSGTLTLDPEKIGIAKLDVSFPVQSLLTTVSVLDDQLKSDQWFDTAKFPTATFVSTTVTMTGSNTATIVGNLELHGVTKPVTLNARLIGSGDDPWLKLYTVGFEATGEIKRSDFNITQFLPAVGDEVTLTIAGSFVLGS